MAGGGPILYGDLLDRGHPLAAGLWWLWRAVPGVRTLGSVRSLAGPAVGAFGASVGGGPPPFGVTHKDVPGVGPVLLYDDGGTGSFVAPRISLSLTWPGQTFSVAGRAYLSGITNSEAQCLISSDGSTGVGGVQFRVSGTGTNVGVLNLVKRSTANVGSSTATVSAGQWFSFGLSRLSGSAYVFYLNGADAGGSGSDAVSFDLSKKDYLLGCGNNTSAGGSAGANERFQSGSMLGWLGVWGRVLTPGDFARLAAIDKAGWDTPASFYRRTSSPRRSGFSSSSPPVVDPLESVHMPGFGW